MKYAVWDTLADEMLPGEYPTYAIAYKEAQRLGGSKKKYYAFPIPEKEKTKMAEQPTIFKTKPPVISDTKELGLFDEE